MTFGDTDHDAKNEVIVYWRDEAWNFSYRILEEQGNNVYALEYLGADLVPYATGDLDQDGKEEIVGQSENLVRVYESPTPTSYPSQLVWSSSVLTNVVGETTIGDTDRDGRMEIIHSENHWTGTASLLIFECAGDNSFQQVASIVTGSGDNGEKVIADLDGDGLVEIALSGLEGVVHIYESPADNTWVETWTDSTGLRNAYGVEGGRDTDGNGKPETVRHG